MYNMLNISSLTIGIISLCVIVAILVAYFFVYLKRGLTHTLICFGIFAVSLVGAIFLAKPVVALFDGWFGFSQIFFEMFMIQFGKIESLNTVVTAVNYSSAVQNFKEADVGISSTIKSFLLRIFEGHNAPSSPTTLSAIASGAFSYLIALFVVAGALFAVFYALLSVLVKFIQKKANLHPQKKLGVVAGFVGLVRGIVVTIIALITLSTFPILGISADYLDGGFETTKVFSPVYRQIVTIEQNTYFSALDFQSRNLSLSEDTSNIKYGTYKNSDNKDFEISITITTPLTFTETVVNKAQNTSSVLTYSYIYSHNRLFAYKDNKLQFMVKYDSTNAKMYYTKTIDGKHISTTLSK